MTVSTTTYRVSYSGNGSTTAFAVPYVFFGAGELRVIARDAAGIETTMVLTTNYTVSGGNGATGTVTAVVAPATGITWTILRVTNRTQLTDYVPNDPFPADTHERALDRLTAIVQEIEGSAGQGLQFPVTETGPFVLLPSGDRANKYLFFDGAGAPTVTAAVTLIPAEIKVRVIQFAVGDEATAITTGTAKITLRAPYAMTITSIRASLNVASSSGVVTVDVNVGASSPATILSTKLTIDASEKSSRTAAIPAVISNTSISDDDEIVVDIDTAGTGATGLKVTIIGTVPA